MNGRRTRSGGVIVEDQAPLFAVGEPVKAVWHAHHGNTKAHLARIKAINCNTVPPTYSVTYDSDETEEGGVPQRLIKRARHDS